MKLEKRHYRKFDRLINFEKPNSLGIKWRFFLFTIILKSASFNNPTFSTIMLIINFLISISPTFYPMLAISTITGSDFSQPEAIFPHSDILSYVTPIFLSTESWFVLVFLFTLLTMLCFIVCLFASSFIVYLHGFLNIRIHFLLLPWITGTLGYSIYILSVNSDQYPIPISFPIVMIIIYPFYLLMLMLLNFADANSMISPNSFSTTWFSLFPFFCPLAIALVSLVGFQCINLPHYALIIVVAITAVICILISLQILFCRPMIFFLANEIQTTRFFSMATFLILSIFVVQYDLIFSGIICTLIPIWIAIVFVGIHLLYEHVRTSSQQLLSQIDSDIDQLTVQSLHTLLQPLNNQMALITFVKEGLLAGNNAVVSDIFVRFCLEKYPTSEWFLSYVTFLYTIIWSSQPDVYRFLLHLLSLDLFSFTTQYTLFQYVYFYMQTSQVESAMIVRSLNKYRQTVLKFVNAHRRFWLAATDRNSKAFQDSSLLMFRLFLSIKRQASLLKLMYPFCPAVCCELSLFEADFNHNISVADQQYKIASALLTPDDEYLTSKLFSGFSLFFPGARKIKQGRSDETESNEYKFLSVQEHYQDAHRQGVSLNVNDIYLSSLTHTFTMSRNQPQINPKVDRIRLFFAYFILIFIILVYLGLLIAHHIFGLRMFDQYDDVEYLNEILNATSAFRRNINIVQYDIILLTNLANKTFQTFITDYEFFRYALEHLALVESEILSYKYLLDNFDPFRTNPSKIDTCQDVNCSFSFLFGILHEKCIFFLHSTDSNETVKEDARDDLEQVLSSLDQFLVNFYQLIYGEYRYEVDDLVHYLKTTMISLLCIEGIMAIFITLIITILLRQMKRNISNVIQTTQPPIIQYIACQFDKLLSFDQFQLFEAHRYIYEGITIPLIFMFLILAVFPIAILFLIPARNNFEWVQNPLPPMMPATDSAQFLYFSLAKLEYSLLTANTNSYQDYEGIVKNDHSCYHDTLKTNTDLTPVYIRISDKFNQQRMEIIHGFCLVISFIIFMLFLYYSYIELQIVQIGRLLLKFIPSSAAQSNPVFAKLLRGQSISSKDVSEFTESIKTSPDDLEFFCVIYYDYMGRIMHCVGDVNKYLTIDPPASIQELAQFVASKVPDEIPSNEVMTFFENKTENEALNVSFSPGHEISLIFSKNPEALVIKDDSNHYEENSRIRMTKKLNKALDSTHPSDLKQIQKVVIATIKPNDEEMLKLIKDVIQRINEFRIIDSRNQIICFIVNAEADEKKSCEDALNFVENTLREFAPKLKITMSIGGPLSFFDSIKNQTTKSRFVGRCYDTVRVLLNYCHFGQALIAKDVYDKAGRDVSSMTFTDMQIASDLNLQVLSV